MATNEDKTVPSNNSGQQTPPSPSDKAARDNRGRQLNPNNDAYWRSRGKSRPKGS